MHSRIIRHLLHCVASIGIALGRLTSCQDPTRDLASLSLGCWLDVDWHSGTILLKLRAVVRSLHSGGNVDE